MSNVLAPPLECDFMYQRSFLAMRLDASHSFICCSAVSLSYPWLFEYLSAMSLRCWSLNFALFCCTSVRAAHTFLVLDLRVEMSCVLLPSIVCCHLIDKSKGGQGAVIWVRASLLFQYVMDWHARSSLGDQLYLLWGGVQLNLVWTAIIYLYFSTSRALNLVTNLGKSRYSAWEKLSTSASRRSYMRCSVYKESILLLYLVTTTCFDIWSSRRLPWMGSSMRGTEHMILTYTSQYDALWSGIIWQLMGKITDATVPATRSGDINM